ncbi:hypothetical protein ACROYT_G032124 [Oculina patagonica]
MAALLETPDNSETPSKEIVSEVLTPKDTLDQPCDVILVVENGKEFKAHKQVLSEASPFFEKLLNSDMKESKEGVVRLEMFSESVMGNTLEFIYTGNVQILTEDNARDLIIMADYLFLQNLKTLAGGGLLQGYNPFSDKWLPLPYTGEECGYFQQIFVTNEDELYAVMSETCEYHGLCRRPDNPRETVFCGKERHVSFIIKYKPESNSWEDISSFDHLGRYHFCIVAKDDFVYFIGGVKYEHGVSCNAQTEVDRYNLRKDQWSKVADIHEGCMFHRGAAVNEQIFIAGLLGSDKLSCQCQVYNETTNEWQVIASPNSTELSAVDARYSGRMAEISWLLMNWESFLSDGLHLSKEGNRFVASQVISILETKLAQLPEIFPDWKDIDPKHPEKTCCYHGAC